MPAVPQRTLHADHGPNLPQHVWGQILGKSQKKFVIYILFIIEWWYTSKGRYVFYYRKFNVCSLYRNVRYQGPNLPQHLSGQILRNSQEKYVMYEIVRKGL